MEIILFMVAWAVSAFLLGFVVGSVLKALDNGDSEDNQE